jgi:hypothetical protein
MTDTETPSPTPRTIEQALADFRAERDFQRAIEKARVEAATQARETREAETARRAAGWMEHQFHLLVPVEQITCSENSVGLYDLDVRASDHSGHVRLNGLLNWNDDGGLKIATLTGQRVVQENNLHLPMTITWHASRRGSYIDAEFLAALDYAFPWPSVEVDEVFPQVQP